MGIGTNDMSTKQNDETQSRWYMANKDGMVTLCSDQADAEQEAKDSQELWPHMGPHRAVQLRESSGAWFTAADMATAAAQGFREGQAAAQAAVAAGWMPIDTAPKDGSAVLVYPPIWVQRTCSVATYKSDRYAKKPRPYWKRDDAMGKVGYSRDKPPTHWRPLPPAPSTEGESGNGVAP